MGYYTSYTLDIKGASKKELQEIAQTIFTDDEYYGLSREDANTITCEACQGKGWIPDGQDHYPEGEATKWYEHEAAMKELSHRFPKVLFELSGDGEDSGDQWRKYYKAGKTKFVKAQIAFPEFDEDELKEAS
jgi:hypothetical protein